MTFRIIGKKVGLDETTLKKYTLYMLTRWGHEEDFQCRTGYAGEWAIRFKKGIEYAASDLCGQNILDGLEVKHEKE